MRVDARPSPSQANCDSGSTAWKLCTLAIIKIMSRLIVALAVRPPGSSWLCLAPPGLLLPCPCAIRLKQISLLVVRFGSYEAALTAGLHTLCSLLERSPPGTSRLLLAPPGFSWHLLAPLAPPGTSWLLLAPPGSSWLLLAPPGSPGIS